MGKLVDAGDHGMFLLLLTLCYVLLRLLILPIGSLYSVATALQLTISVAALVTFNEVCQLAYPSSETSQFTLYFWIIAAVWASTIPLML